MVEGNFGCVAFRFLLTLHVHVTSSFEPFVIGINRCKELRMLRTSRTALDGCFAAPNLAFDGHEEAIAHAPCFI